MNPSPINRIEPHILENSTIRPSSKAIRMSTTNFFDVESVGRSTNSKDLSTKLGTDETSSHYSPVHRVTIRLVGNDFVDEEQQSSSSDLTNDRRSVLSSLSPLQTSPTSRFVQRDENLPLRKEFGSRVVNETVKNSDSEMLSSSSFDQNNRKKTGVSVPETRSVEETRVSTKNNSSTSRNENRLFHNAEVMVRRYESEIQRLHQENLRLQFQLEKMMSEKSRVVAQFEEKSSELSASEIRNTELCADNNRLRSELELLTVTLASIFPKDGKSKSASHPEEMFSDSLRTSRSSPVYSPVASVSLPTTGTDSSSSRVSPSLFSFQEQQKENSNSPRSISPLRTVRIQL